MGGEENRRELNEYNALTKSNMVYLNYSYPVHLKKQPTVHTCIDIRFFNYKYYSCYCGRQVHIAFSVQNTFFTQYIQRSEIAFNLFILVFATSSTNGLIVLTA